MQGWLSFYFFATLTGVTLWEILIWVFVQAILVYLLKKKLENNLKYCRFGASWTEHSISKVILKIYLTCLCYYLSSRKIMLWCKFLRRFIYCKPVWFSFFLVFYSLSRTNTVQNKTTSILNFKSMKDCRASYSWVWKISLPDSRYLTTGNSRITTQAELVSAESSVHDKRRRRRIPQLLQRGHV